MFMTTIVPFSVASGQDKKTEKKVKINVAGKDGTKTVIDTVFIDESTPGTIPLKDGKIIYFDYPGSLTTDITNDNGKKKIYITNTVDDDDDGEKTKEK